ncbi:sulfite exporter TauE/SafE family protein [Agrobacterium vitis]|uniref:sulfite exporter TauE/SafE family protein n=1 Tax=Agrobacterium vitis TaxID=373 RepID=UPI001571E4A4|nr:sulfite exporter TauE/SafE family protein [Agrobacterium vitis]NSZ19948.1 sulfite exporter TauE/SafE family protein [Agrobacterium vitis]QZO07351.1 sulfite exporter TauE/SafE family protein [Agrobacterium vitis]UJL90845.1 sulfite exporter TauE/SafE family protein [Agrobacterium vitis]
MFYEGTLTLQMTLFLSGVLGGIVNAIAGGATLFTFPIMLGLGLPPIMASATNQVSVTPSHLAAAISGANFRRSIQQIGVSYMFIALIGGGLGLKLLAVTPPTLFVLFVPMLIFAATIVYAFAGKIQKFFSKNTSSLDFSFLRVSSNYLFLFAIAIYGGYFGAGLGIIIVAFLAISENRSPADINYDKNILAALISCAAVVVAAFTSLIKVSYVLPTLSGAILGGALGGQVATKLSSKTIRTVVVCLGAVSSAYYAVKYWI